MTGILGGRGVKGEEDIGAEFADDTGGLCRRGVQALVGVGSVSPPGEVGSVRFAASLASGVLA